MHDDIAFLTLRGRLPPDVGQVAEMQLGGIEVSSRTALYTVIGASVAVCLIDKQHRTAGMCHVMLPARFGHHREDAMLKADGVLEALVARLVEIGQPADGAAKLQAKLFGGAESNPDALSFSDGKQSVMFARTWLRTRGIPILNESTGGSRRREILLLPEDGKVFCKQVSLSSEFLDRERDGLLAAEQPLNKVELF